MGGLRCTYTSTLPLQVRLLLLAALAGEHILYIGPPGTAKSELGRRLARLYDGSFFERLLTRFSVPEVCAYMLPANARCCMQHPHVAGPACRITHGATGSYKP